MKNLGKWGFGPAKGVRGIHLLVEIHNTLCAFLSVIPSFHLQYFLFFFLSFFRFLFFHFLFYLSGKQEMVEKPSTWFQEMNWEKIIFISTFSLPCITVHKIVVIFFLLLLLLLLLWTCTTLVQGYSSSAWVRFKTGLARPVILNQRNKICKKLLVYSWGRSKKARKSSTRVEHALDVNN